MPSLERIYRRIVAGQWRGLAERLLARLPPQGLPARLPDFPATPVAPPPRCRPGTGQPIRTLVAGPSFGLEGAPFSQLELVTALSTAGIIEPLVMATRDGPLRHSYQRQGIPSQLGLPAMGDLYDDADFTAAAETVAEILNAERIDLVFAVTLLAAPAVEAARLRGLPVVWNPRESTPPAEAFHRFGATVAARALACMRYPRAVVFVAEATRALWSAISDERFHVVPNALSPDRIATLHQGPSRDAARKALGIGADDVMVLTPGTICGRKGQRDLVRAAARMQAEAQARARFFLVGEAPDEYGRRLAHDIRDLPEQIMRRFHIEPATAEIGAYFRAADVMVLPSREESCPRVVLEALASGLPMLVTPVFGVPEQVDEDGGALFFNPGDHAALAGQLSRITLDGGLREAMAERARQRFAGGDDFSVMVERYASILLAAAGGDASVPAGRG
jgi:glycosyltransferase involved in cell wall biosynthesis